MSKDYCVCCGEVIPEGRMVCSLCEKVVGKETKRDAHVDDRIQEVTMGLFGIGSQLLCGTGLLVAADQEEENEKIKKQLKFSVASVHSQKELDAYNAFVEKHAKCRLKRKIDGGKKPYVIQHETGIGCCTTVYCQVCGASQDITDVSCW